MKREYIVGLILVLLTLAAFYQVLGHDFIRFYDDDEYVVNNRQVTAGLTKDSVVWAFTKYHSANWHPLTWLSHMLDAQIWGLNPMGHHLTNLVFHVLNSLLLFLVLFRMTNCVWRSGFVAALFAVHPTHVESVAWVSERKDVLSTFFMMLTLLAYVGYVRAGGKQKYLLVLGLYALGLMAKPMLVTLPLLLLMLDFWPLGRAVQEGKKQSGMHIWQRLVIEKIPFFALALGSCIITVVAQSSVGAVAALQRFPLPVRVGNAMVAYVSYIGKMIWPANLSFFYPSRGSELQSEAVLGAVLVLAAISIVAVRAMRRSPYLMTGWLWYLVTLVPVIGIVQVGEQSMADRYTYIPFIGLFVMLAWGVPDLLAGRTEARKPVESRRKKKQQQELPPPEVPQHGVKLAILAGIAIAALTVCTWIEVGYWKDNVTLFERALEVTTRNNMAHNNLGNVLMQQGKLEEAAEHYQAALRISPGMTDARNNLGNVIFEMGGAGNAVEHYREALRLDPKNAGAHYNLGMALAKEGKLHEAIQHYQEALRLQPDNAKAHNNLGNALARSNRLDEAIEQYEIAKKLQPDLSEAYNNLGNVLLNQGKPGEAAAQYREALRLEPNNADANRNLGLVLIGQQKVDEAIKHYREAIRIKPDFGQVYYDLAVAFSLKKQYAESWKHIHRLRELGYEADQTFLQELSQNMPDPGR